ncbi:MAG: hypothetical protein ACJ790_08255 [Myxococcaceae bacterium]
MLYKVTPMMTPAEEAKPKKARREPGAPRKRRKTAIYDGEGHEVLITLMCLKCKGMKPLAQFGLRKMADGAIRNQPWCRGCRSQAGTKPVKPATQTEVAVTAESELPVVIEAEAAPHVTEDVTQPMGEAVADGTALPSAAEPDPTYG